MTELQDAIQSLKNEINSISYRLDDLNSDVDNLVGLALKDGLTDEQQIYFDRLLFSKYYVSNSYILEKRENVDFDSLKKTSKRVYEKEDKIFEDVLKRKGDLKPITIDKIKEIKLANMDYVNYFNDKYPSVLLYHIDNKIEVMNGATFVGLIMCLKIT